MKLYKKVIPYFLMGSAALSGNHTAIAQDLTMPAVKLPQPEIQLKDNTTFARLGTVMQTYPFTNTAQQLSQRATNTCNTFMSNMLDARKRLAPLVGTRNYHAAVRQELPGAPVGMHCMYGQYTQLMRALDANGDTLTIIPDGGNRMCAQFKIHMRKKYTAPEYAGTIYEGRAYESDSAYNAAFERFMTQRRITDATATDQRRAAIADFESRNFPLSSIKPGAIMIVPRYRGSRNTLHAIMFLGKGRIDAGEFIPDDTGQYMFIAHNREQMGPLAQTWDIGNVFVADIERILEIEYAKELKRLESMPRDEMIRYLSDGTEMSYDNLARMTRIELMHLVRAKYFGADIGRALAQPVAAGTKIALHRQGHPGRS